MIYDLLTIVDLVGVFMEHFPLGNLKDAVIGYPDQITTLYLKIALDIVSGLSYLSKLVVYHRDLKFENILVATPHTLSHFVDLKFRPFSSNSCCPF
jgi:serine/threonine protein kinase